MGIQLSIAKRSFSHSKFSEVALTCAVDVCRAAAYIDPEGDVPLRLVASDIAHEIRVSCDTFSCHRPNLSYP